MDLRILDFIYAFQAATQVSASSADSEFPTSNLLSAFRSKVWRSSGNFVIDATNNKIDFQEANAGTVFHATVASGTYTATTLAAAIVTALQAVGAKTYTCSYSTATGLWTIATTNGTFLSLLWNSGANTAVSTGLAIGFSALTDSTGALTYAGGQVASHTEEWIVFDHGNVSAIDSVALFFDSMRGIPFSSNAQLWIQANATNSWSSPAVSQALTIDTDFNASTYFFSSDQSYRYWRLLIKDPKNTNLYVEVSKLTLAKATKLSRLPDNGFTYTLMDKSTIQETPYGHRYADLYPIRKQLDFNFNALSYANVKTLESIFRRVGRSSPIVVSHDSTETLYDKEQFLIYGELDKDFNPQHMVGSFFQWGATIMEAM